MKLRRVFICCGIFLGVCGLGVESTEAQQAYEFGIRFNPVRFQPTNFSGFSFQQPSFRSQIGQPIQFETINFPAFNARAVRQRRNVPPDRPVESNISYRDRAMWRRLLNKGVFCRNDIAVAQSSNETAPNNRILLATGVGIRSSFRHLDKRPANRIAPVLRMLRNSPDLTDFAGHRLIIVLHKFVTHTRILVSHDVVNPLKRPV